MMSDDKLLTETVGPLDVLVPKWIRLARELRSDGEAKIAQAERLEAMAKNAAAFLPESAQAELFALSGVEQAAQPASRTATPAAMNGSEVKLVGLNAIRTVLAEDPERIWGGTELHRELERRGWVTGDAKNAAHGTRTGLYRLWDNKEIGKVGTGRYRGRRDAGAALV
jgi:hypothetical protein